MPLSKLEKALEIAEQLLQYLPEIREVLEALGELRKRQGRNAAVGDLEDSIARLEALDRA